MKLGSTLGVNIYKKMCIYTYVYIKGPKLSNKARKLHCTTVTILSPSWFFRHTLRITSVSMKKN